MVEERTLESERVFEGRVIQVRVDKVSKPDGRETSREIVEHGACVAIVAIGEDDNVLLESQFRKPVEKEILEIPAGGIELGEDPEDAVSRELREEVGYLPKKIELMGGFYSAPGYSSEYLYLYLATQLVPERLYAEDTDEIELVRVPANEIPALVASGRICDSKSIAGLLMYLLKYRDWARAPED